MLLRRYCLASLFCLAVSVASGQQPPRAEVVVPPLNTEGSLRAVVIEVTIAQWRTKPDKEGDKPSAPALENVDLAALEKSGELRVKERIRLTTLDQQKAFFQRGESVPTVTGVNTTRGGFAQRSVNYQQVGTMVTVTPHIKDDRIIVEAKIDRSAVDDEGGALLSKEEDGHETRAPIMSVGTSQTTVSIAPGKTVIVGGMTRSGKETSTGEVILISAEVVK